MNKETRNGLMKISIIVFFYIAILFSLTSWTGSRVEASGTEPEVNGITVSEEATVPEQPKQVTLALVGDILMDSWVGTEIQTRGVDYPWVKVKEILSGADLAVGNLESSVGVGGAPIKGKRFTFRARPETLQGVVNAGIDVVGLANNHVLDYGTTALGETLDNLDHYGIARTGAGRTIYEALTPVIREVNGLKIGVLSFSRVIPYGWWVAGHSQAGVANGWDTKVTLDAIQKAKSKVDLLVVSIHWGKELADYPGADQTALAKAMVDNGADLILGHHSHCLQGVAVYKNKPILYSIGNFVFTSSSQKARTGAIALVTMGKDGVKELNIIPTRLDRGQPQVLEENAKLEEIKRVEVLSKPFGVTLDNDGNVEFYKHNHESNN